MARPQKLEIRKGATWKHVIRWETKPTVFKPITGATQSAPCQISVPDHNIPNGWRIMRISGATGMKSINTHSSSGGVYLRTPLGTAFPSGLRVTVIDDVTLALDDVNSSVFPAWVSGGVIEYNTPVPLGGFTGIMHLRSSVKSTSTLIELNEGNGRILINPSANTITLQLSAEDTAAITFKSAVASLEMTSSTGEVTILLSNSPVSVRETDVTR